MFYAILQAFDLYLINDLLDEYRSFKMLYSFSYI